MYMYQNDKMNVEKHKNVYVNLNTIISSLKTKHFCCMGYKNNPM